MLSSVMRYLNGPTDLIAYDIRSLIYSSRLRPKSYRTKSPQNIGSYRNVHVRALALIDHAIHRAALKISSAQRFFTEPSTLVNLGKKLRPVVVLKEGQELT